jgi:hypothetical protein
MGNWDNLTEDSIEEFIKINKDKFDIYRPKSNHEEHFVIKLHKKFQKIISIIPHLIKVAIATVLIFAISIWLWNSYIRWDRRYVTLPQKVENTYHKWFHGGK